MLRKQKAEGEEMSQELRALRSEKWPGIWARISEEGWGADMQAPWGRWWWRSQEQQCPSGRCWPTARVGLLREEQIMPVVRGRDPGLSEATSETRRKGLFRPKQVYAGIYVTFHQARFLNRNGTLCPLCYQGIQNKDSSWIQKAYSHSLPTFQEGYRLPFCK